MPDSRRLPAHRGEPIEIVFNDTRLLCYRGETIATALLAADVHEFGTTRTGQPRQPLCNMGTCFDCAVTVNGVLLTRACLTDAADGMTVRTSRGA